MHPGIHLEDRTKCFPQFLLEKFISINIFGNVQNKIVKQSKNSALKSEIHYTTVTAN